MKPSSSLSIQQYGSGEQPLVMVHGWAMHCGLFQPLLNMLASRFRLYLLDLPGHGINHSSSLALRPQAVVDQVAGQLPDQAIWLGWSMGGLFAIEAARQGRAGGLVMLASTPCFVRRADWPHAVASTVFEDFSRRLEHSVSDTLKRFLLLETHGAEHPRELLKTMQTLLTEQPEPSSQTLASGLDLLCQQDSRSAVVDLAIPTLWLAGRRDRLVPWQAARDLAKRMPESRVRLFERAGHAPFITDTDKIAESLVRFGRHVLESTT